MNVSGTLKNGGMILGGLWAITALFALGILFIVGATVASLLVMKWVPVVFWSSLLIVIFVLGPISLIRPTRALAAIGVVIASYVFGVITWCAGLAITYAFWGVTGVIIGLLFAGVGIVPVAMLATLLHGQWVTLIELVILIVLTFGLRALGVWLALKADERAARLALQKAV
jgi:hypothetical protein